MFAGMLLTFALTATAPLELVLPDDVPVESVVDESTVSSGDSFSSPDVMLLADTLESIDEKLDVMVMALNPTVDAYQVSDYYKDYFRGILQNMPYTEYLCYAERLGYNNYNYVTHYYLLYDLKIENGNVVPGTYPCIDVYQENNVYYADETTKYFSGYPTLGFASFAPYSALIDRSFDYNSLYIGLICVCVFFILARKTVFS